MPDYICEVCGDYASGNPPEVHYRKNVDVDGWIKGALASIVCYIKKGDKHSCGACQPCYAERPRVEEGLCVPAAPKKLPTAKSENRASLKDVMSTQGLPVFLGVLRLVMVASARRQHTKVINADTRNPHPKPTRLKRYRISTGYTTPPSRTQKKKLKKFS